MNNEQAIGMLQAGVSVRDVARACNVHRTSVSRLHQKFLATGNVKDRPRPGQPRNTTAPDDCSIRLRVLRNCKLSALSLQREVRRERHLVLSTETIHRCLRLQARWTQIQMSDESRFMLN